MSEKRARYTGTSQTGVDLSIPVTDGEFLHVHVGHGAELPAEVDGVKVPASYRDALLAQGDEWSEVRRATGDDVKSKSPAKEDDR